jgi:hypothetical protein
LTSLSLKVQFWKSNNGKDHVFVTFEDPKAVQYVLNLKNELPSRLPVKPVNQVSLNRYERPPSVISTRPRGSSFSSNPTRFEAPDGRQRSGTPNPYSRNTATPEPRDSPFPLGDHLISYNSTDSSVYAQRVSSNSLPPSRIDNDAFTQLRRERREASSGLHTKYHPLEADMRRLEEELKNVRETNTNLSSSLDSALADLSRIRQERDRFRYEFEMSQQETRRLKDSLSQQKGIHDNQINMQKELHRADRLVLDLRNDIKAKDTTIKDLEIQLFAAQNESKHLRDVLDDKSKPSNSNALESPANGVHQTDTGEGSRKGCPSNPSNVDQQQNSLPDPTVGPSLEHFQRVAPALAQVFNILEEISSSVVKQSNGPDRKKRKLNDT